MSENDGPVWPEGKKWALSISFDDGRQSQVETGMPLFETLDLRATFYLIPKNLNAFLDGWKQAVAFGHEIGNHSYTHPCTGNNGTGRWSGS